MVNSLIDPNVPDPNFLTFLSTSLYYISEQAIVPTRIEWLYQNALWLYPNQTNYIDNKCGYIFISIKHMYVSFFIKSCVRHLIHELTLFECCFKFMILFAVISLTVRHLEWFCLCIYSKVEQSNLLSSLAYSVFGFKNFQLQLLNIEIGEFFLTLVSYLFLLVLLIDSASMKE